MSTIKFYKKSDIPVEMHKARIVQQIELLPINDRKKALTNAGNNMFLLNNRDIFLDMLTDSGVNAMSTNMESAMFRADDSYAGSETYIRFVKKIKDIFDMDYFLPAHQGRACENILCTHYVKPGNIIPMNFRFDSTKDHIGRAGGFYKEFLVEEGLQAHSDVLFKGNFDIEKLRCFIEKEGSFNIPFVRIEAGTNLIGGQPVSLQNMKSVAEICKEFGIKLILDASLLQDNLYFIKTREEEYKDMSIRDITKEIASLMDIIYFSARKLGFARGGGLCFKDKKQYDELLKYIPTFEGFTTYGGMSVREMEAIIVGLDETMQENVISQGPLFIEYMVNELQKNGVPVVTPGGGLGAHVCAREFLPHIPMEQYPAGALAAALYLCSGVRTMERGTISEDRNADGTERLSEMELLRIALPRRVFTLSQVDYTIDRLLWLFDNRKLIKGLRFISEPETLRFYFGYLEPVSDWQEELILKYQKDFGAL